MQWRDRRSRRTHARIMVWEVQVQRVIAMRVRTLMPVFMVVMVERRVELSTGPALVVRDRHDLATPYPERKLRQQHYARDDLGRRPPHDGQTVCQYPVPVKGAQPNDGTFAGRAAPTPCGDAQSGSIVTVSARDCSCS
jgi:hypothetical protein